MAELMELVFGAVIWWNGEIYWTS